MAGITEGIEEMSETISICQRELDLYPDPKLFSLMEKLYMELLNFLQAARKVYSSKTSGAFRNILDTSFQKAFERSSGQIRKLSEAVLREVDYHHRLEMRESSSRLKDMEQDQRKILQGLEDQKQILESMQEERKIMTMVQDQQKILQAVQAIQMRMQMITPGE
jgi:hypothetical protein